MVNSEYRAARKYLPLTRHSPLTIHYSPPAWMLLPGVLCRLYAVNVFSLLLQPNYHHTIKLMNTGPIERLTEFNNEVNLFIDSHSALIQDINNTVTQSGWSRELKQKGIDSVVEKLNFIQVKLKQLQEKSFQEELQALGIEVLNIALKVEELLIKMLAEAATELYQMAQIRF